jgi:hypothetical protein
MSSAPSASAEPRPSGADAVRVASVARLGAIDRAAFAVLSLLGLGAIGLFARAWWQVGWGTHPVLVLGLAGLAAMLVINQQGRWFLLLPMRRPLPVTALPGLRVAVVTTYVPGVESLPMLEQTLRAMVAMRYPHDTWLLDEGNDPDARALCARLGVRHFTRQGHDGYQADEGSYKRATKHGNYNAWLDAVGYASYDALVAFDPDHVPLPHYLDSVLGYFRDPGIGYVQVAQAYYNQRASLVACGAAEETYAYFSAVQMAGYGLAYPIIVGGHNAHRMAALEAVGGFAIHDADDLLLTLRYRAAGWNGVYVPEVLARGLTPVDWRGYLVQQRRWARSVLDLKLRHSGSYAGSLPFASRMLSYLHGLNFLHRALAYFGVVLVVLYLLVTGGTLSVLDRAMLPPTLLLLAALGAQELFRQRFYLDWKHESGLHWRAGILGYAKWPWFLLALVDVLMRRRIGYTITNKSVRHGGYRPFVAWHAAVAAVLVAAWAVGRAQGALPPVIEWIAAAFALASLALAVGGAKAPPPPYDASLLAGAPLPDRG